MARPRSYFAAIVAALVLAALGGTQAVTRRQRARIAGLEAEAARKQAVVDRLEAGRARRPAPESGAAPFAPPAAESLVHSEPPGLEEGLLARVRRVRLLVEQDARGNLPEFALWKDQDWVKAAVELDFDRPGRIASGLRDLRSRVKMQFAALLQDALREFAAANQDRLPQEIAELQPYMAAPGSEAMLRRYEMVETGLLGEKPAKAWLIAERTTVAESDTRQVVGLGQMAQTDPNRGQSVALQAIEAYRRANGDRKPSDSWQLSPYLETPLADGDLQDAFELWRVQPATLGLPPTRVSDRR